MTSTTSTHPTLLPAIEAGPRRTSERVVLAIDRSAASDAALLWTVDRAQRTPVEVDVVTVVKPDPVLGDVMIEEFMLNGEQLLHHAADVLRPAVAAESLRTLLAWGSPAREILAAAEGADLLVIGTANATRHPVFHHPSIAARLATVARCDLAIVPAGWHAHPDSGPVVAGVAGDDGDRVIIAIAACEAERLGARLVLVHSWESPSLTALLSSGLTIDVAVVEEKHQHMLDDAVSGIAEAFPELSVSGVLSDVPASRALRTAASDAALLVVGSHGWSALDRFFVGSTSHDLATSPVCPTLVIRSRSHRAVRSTTAIPDTGAIDGTKGPGLVEPHGSV
ncbi:nucleotide-binding universal stress UspA family protein [Labedella gwakjiensis]|uniref:Nucleotide-binding universal stress UspA family protein n=1 Tax=Labedella gwakjiensis TaxID=390269 RepID=A0A2P8GT68_9MICO|nr:universal stress protein [Labedella gwakjiensis]PSL37160.1 nucleotide-binding universal stress UspA family protein [Labedella gwakjiensis]RUQ81941.1 universal stress protein [Labedella gwakjiensis]